MQHRPPRSFLPGFSGGTSMKTKPAKTDTLKSFKDGLRAYFAGKGKRHALSKRHGLTLYHGRETRADP